MTFEVTVEATGDYLNTAEITAADQDDVDSTPNNDDGDQSEDDEDNEIVEPIQLATIGDFVWLDENGDGIQNPGEPGLAGAIVKLLDSAGNEVAQVTTLADGMYLFEDVIPGSYFIQVMAPNNLYQFSDADQGGNDNLDSDVDPGTMTSQKVILAPADDNRTVDAGLFLPASIGNQVWIDQPGGIDDVFDLSLIHI